MVAPSAMPVSQARHRSRRSSSAGGSEVEIGLAFEAEVDESTSWTANLARWLKTVAATGYGVSVAVHLVVLIALSLVIITTQMPEEPTIHSVFVEHAVTDFEETSLKELTSVTLEPMESREPVNPVDLLSSTSPADLVSTILDASTSAEVGAAKSAGKSAGYQMPGGGRAVTKGSFTAWTVPEDPEPREDYLVVIQVRLPEKIRRYRKEDLSGFLNGDDGYQTPLGNFTGRGFPKQFYGRFDDKTRQFVIRIPGGAAKVRDTIQIGSKLLREEQKIEITF